MSSAVSHENFELTVWQRAVLAIALFAIDPARLGGMTIRSLPGPGRDRLLAYLRSLLPLSAPMIRIPVNIGIDRLLGGIDLAATLQSGASIAARGVLAEADGGVIVLAMAERVSLETAAHISSALDNGEVTLERDGFSSRGPAKFGVIALDEGLDADERLPATLFDRLALHVDLSDLRISKIDQPTLVLSDIESARSRLASVRASTSVIEALCTTATALGIDSIRAPILALHVARAAAALAQRQEISDADAAIAAQVVLAPRATMVPELSEQVSQKGGAAESNADTEQISEKTSESSGKSKKTQGDKDGQNDAAKFNDVVLAAARASVPAGLLAGFRDQRTNPTHRQTAGRMGMSARSSQLGRPAGVRRGKPGQGARLNILETLRAAAPLQRLRANPTMALPSSKKMKVRVRLEDFHVTRYRRRAATTTIFVLDASGSSALYRLAEAKGAVELLLADCYVRRDQVAVVTFRGKTAEVLLPPTRSLVRVKRNLAELPGGGGTPLAAGIEAGRTLAEAVLRRGATPTLVLLTDGRANIALDGGSGRDQAGRDVINVARRVKAASIRTVLIDTSTRPQAAGELLAAQLGAKYMPLPHADAAALANAVQPASVHHR